MAINVYTPGCHLLCHDDVIGSRRVSYILYLTDPDKPWRAEWGGALRLYPTETMGEGEERALVPLPDFSVVIPPAWNQLSFFAVQPGESFHDVEEVYARGEGEPGEDVDGGRVRMAISGWFHIPQEGEEGYEPGAEEKLAARSSLSQLEGKADQYDLPQPRWREYDGGAQEDGYEKGKAKLEEVGQQAELSEDDLQFLLRFMTPHYLTPDTVEELSELFADESSLRLSNLLSPKFSAHLREFVEEAEKNSEIPSSKADGLTGKARPPHKHRFLYRHAADESPEQADAQTPYDALLDTFLPSTAFKKWLSLATGLTLSRSNVLARRFRRGLDYTLATSYDEPEPQLEICLAITPSKGWGEEENEDEEAEDDETSEDGDTIEHDKANGRASRADEPPRGKKAPWNGTENGDAQKGSTAAAPAAAPATETDGVGGYEVYMAGDDDDDEEDAANGREVTGDRSTGAGQRRRRADPAVYRSGGGAEDEDGVLFSMAPSWNNMSIVLRDTGVLRFVKYVSRAARGDRWDVVGDFGVVPEEDEAEE
ncbi:Oxoglutarate and iron-dependent oxygenase degradation C-term-domain-containing protein [Lineolata rhizophorae]|uniref:Oxoglutarate and iron-dependent oxygenase degradation C-term-domain-containing protein n=1 Tax=Lineolata rhizophorae TaxID=578093 RepID=A0A6A6P813_9PEZI|nr:Oxoglutarate and iron-dependent oxygenase degradation C-term-domain-containing protein [Lineolata rhizophorae]